MINIYYKIKQTLRFTKNISKYIFVFFISFIFIFFLQDNIKFNDDIGFSLALLLSTLIFLFLLKRENKSPIDYLKIHKVKFRTILLLMCFSIILILFDLITSKFLENFITTDTISNTKLYFWSLFHLIFLAPICEEIFFRGILFQKLKEIFSLFSSIIIQGCLFGVAHGAFSGHLIQSLLAGFSGILYALIFTYSNNLTISILIHIFYNSFLVILNLFFL